VHCAARGACAALTSTASRWLNSALRVAAAKPAVTRMLRGALHFLKEGGGAMQCIVLLAARALPSPQQRPACCRSKASGDPHDKSNELPSWL
jgi:hypothetical protein